MINEIVGNRAGIRLVERRKWDTKSRLLASIDRARDLIGYQPNTPFETGIQATVAWFRQNWEAIESAARFTPGAVAAVRQVCGTPAEASMAAGASLK
jgi:dTDP-D-glucose 4,6-dehydratase